MNQITIDKKKEQFLNHYSNAQVFFSNGKYDEALEQLKLAAEYDPENLKPYLLSLEIFLQVNDPKNIINVSNYMLKKEPQNIEVKTKLAYGYLQLENYEIAKNLSEEILAEHLTNLTAKEVLADSLYKGTHDYEKARDIYLELYEEVKAPDRILLKLTACYQRLNDNSNLARTCKKLLDLGYRDKKIKQLYNSALNDKKSGFLKNEKDLTFLQKIKVWLADPWIHDIFDIEKVVDRELKHKESERRLDDTTRRLFADELTGINNRAFFDEKIKPLFAEKETLSLLHFDIDKFKVVNDNFGHEMGDHVLQTFAQTGAKFFKQHKGELDFQTFSRYGGEEFLAVVFSNKETAYKIADDFRIYIQDILQKKVKDQTKKDIPIITCSGGVSEYPKEGKDFAESYSSADKRLYEAKQTGRNKIVYR